MGKYKLLNIFDAAELERMLACLVVESVLKSVSAHGEILGREEGHRVLQGTRSLVIST